jgi:hypothetical protein
VESCGLVLITQLTKANTNKMATAGYSGTTLLKKLGIKPEMKVLLFNEPDNYLNFLQTDITNQLISSNVTPDFIHLFAVDCKAFENGMKKVLLHSRKNTAVIVWVSWYKKSAGIATDLNENIIRDFALKNNLVDIKVCAVSDLWSGLKLVVPVAKRN